MALTVTISFDDSPARVSWRVRFRAAGYDKTLNVPRKLFVAAGVDSKKETDRGRKIAERWAHAKAAELEGLLPIGEATFIDRWRGKVSDADLAAIANLEPDQRERIASQLAAVQPANLPPEMTLKQVLQHLRDKNPGDVIDETLARYDRLASPLVRILGLRRPSEIGPADALEYRNLRAAETVPGENDTVRNRTIKNELQHLLRALKHAVEWKRDTGVATRVLDSLPPIRRQAPLGVQLTDEEVKAIFSARLSRDTLRVRMIFAVALTSMLRVENLLTLRRDWYDFERGRRVIPAEDMKGQRGEKRELSVPISKWEAQVVRAAISQGPKRSELVFPNFRGRSSKWPIRSVRSICKATGVRYFSAHDFRRTGTAILEEAGRSKIEIQWLMGHAPGGDVTDDYVARATRVRTEQRLVDAVAVFDAFRERLGIDIFANAENDRKPRGGYKTGTKRAT